METKICKMCGIEKSLSKFYKQKRNLREYYDSYCRECRSDHRKQWVKLNPDYYKEYNEKKREQKRQYNSQLYEKNRKKIKERVKQYRRERRSIDPLFRLRDSVTSQIYNSLKENKSGRHWEIIVGYTLTELTQHLEAQFKTGMSWDNYGMFGWHIDHIKPQVLFDFTDPEQIKDCWALSNLQPLWAEENLRKHDKYMGG